MDTQTWIEVFKFAPAIAALLAVIYLMYKIIQRKDETIKDLVKLSEQDTARSAKMITLLEILVNRGNGK
jgi:type IV secretory pathway VirB3-like protein